eukprot:gb/GFBE01020382.1/.p1 GENE.gb/GFBE01020382.1/~~gb/GFBE01020382.1/.p1  ORF type:complete len:682 (+),score=120.87 gb/GFBE01020382.1/:1-2046(+)
MAAAGKSVLLGAMAGVAVMLQGCEDVYRDTCVWHSDLNIKGCSYYGYRGCIQHCDYCITQNGPDECAQMKCAAYCAKREGDGACLDNYKSLCTIALDEFMKKDDGTGHTCDVNCNSADGRKPAGLLLPLVLLFSLLSSGAVPSMPSRSTLLCCVLAFIACSMQGCYCSEWPEPQLTWRPDGSVFNERTRRIENGIWRGNPTWQWFPELESEDYQCVAMHPTKNLCAVWTTHEWNCGEHDFGVCKCREVPDGAEYCSSWGCHSLEADQEICHVTRNDDGESISCFYDPFPMNWDRYDQILTQQAGGALTTGESISLTQRLGWWSYNSMFSADGGPLGGRRLTEEEFSSQSSEDVFKEYVDFLRTVNSTVVDERLGKAGEVPARALATGQGLDFPPIFAYNPIARYTYFSWDEVCIVNGDNLAMARRKCHQWREIETEISQCECLEAHSSGKACAKWSCEERDIGLFSILFRTEQPIDQYTVGVEYESYVCKSYNIDNKCTSWEGDIGSPEEVEWTACKCSGSSCDAQDARWLCDEWELPKTRDLFYEEYVSRLLGFVFWEVFCCLNILRAVNKDDGDGSAFCFLATASSMMGLCLLPFLVVSFGFYGFLCAGLPFWVCRGCMFCMCLAKSVNDVAEERPSNQVRFKRGATAFLGKKKVQPEQEGESSNQVSDNKEQEAERLA